MSVLGAVLPLGTGPGAIEDTEKLVRRVLDDRLRKFGTQRISAHDYEDAVTFLCGEAWKVSSRYDVKKDKKPNLAAYVAHIVSLRVADWYRHRFGDTRHNDRPVVLSLDAPATLSDGDVDDEAGRSQLVEALAASSGNPADDCSPDLLGLLNGGSRSPVEAHDALGQPADRGAQARDHRSRPGVAAERSPAGKKSGRIAGTYRQSPPICGTCLPIFATTLEQAELAKPEQTRKAPEEVAVMARGRARAIRVEGEWICPRCTTDPAVRALVHDKAYPQARKYRRQREREQLRTATPKRRK